MQNQLEMQILLAKLLSENSGNYTRNDESCQIMLDNLSKPTEEQSATQPFLVPSRNAGEERY